MKIEIEAISPVEKKVTVEFDREAVAKEFDRAYASLGRRVKLRGFRAGKVPRNVLERHFRGEAEADVVEKLMSSGFGGAMRENEIEPIAPPRFDMGDGGIKAAEPFRFSARVEVKPKLEPKDYKGLEAARPASEVTDQMIEDELARIQDGHSRMVPLEGRAEAAEGDFAVVDHEGTIDGQPFEGGTGRDLTVRVGPGELVAGYVPQLIGKRVGDAVEFDQAFPADYRAEHVRGKVARVKITLKELQTRQVPALDDVLARVIGLEGVDTLEKLRARIREDFQKRASRRAETELKEALIKAALARNDFEVPPSLVERTIDTMIGSAREGFARQGVNLRDMEVDLPRLRANLREQALFRVKGALLLEAIADAEKIEVTDQDVEAEIAKTAAELEMPLARVQQELRGGGALNALRNKIREDKAVAFLTSEAKLN